MLKLQNKSPDNTNIIEMSEMCPYEVGQIMAEDSAYHNHYVMRTASTTHFEVINLTEPGEDVCWGEASTLPVRLLSPNEKLYIELYND